MKILFICKHNRFRSKVAEAIFNKLNKNEKIKADSRGIILDELRPYVADNVIKIMKEKGYSVGGKPRLIVNAGINKYSLLIIVADNVDKESFLSLGFKGKIIKWKINDTDEKDISGILNRIDKIELKVKELVRKLEYYKSSGTRAEG